MGRFRRPKAVPMTPPLRPSAVACAAGLTLSCGWLAALPAQDEVAPAPAAAAAALLAALDADQTEQAVLNPENPSRRDWHFIPKEARKGVALNAMTAPQRAAAADLLRSLLSAGGYELARNVMTLEAVLAVLEENPVRRDPLKYSVTFFGTPAEPGPGGRWAVSVEGHHLSLNFLLRGDAVLASTPAFFGSNPAKVPREVAGVPAGTRVLADAEDVGFTLLNALSDEQRAVAVVSNDPPREIRGPGDGSWVAPAMSDDDGLPAAEMDEEQRRLLQTIVDEHLAPMPAAVRAERRAAFGDAGGIAALRFAWLGATAPGVGHGYRVRGPATAIEFVNSQPDSFGNPANHAHAVRRDPAGDFGDAME